MQVRDIQQNPWPDFARPPAQQDREEPRGNVQAIGQGKIIAPWQWEDEVERQQEEQQKMQAAMAKQHEQQAERDRLEALINRLQRAQQPQSNVIPRSPGHLVIG